MRPFLATILTAGTLLWGGASALAADGNATRDEAVAMVQRAAKHLASAGKEKAFADFSTKGGPFSDRDLYVVVYDLTGKCLAHGANEKLIGKDLIDAEDIDGKLYIKERVEMAKANKSFWQDYKFTNPTSKKVEPKEMYCQVESNLAVCAGVYKK
ncbi:MULTISPECIES: cache domain-containing protein [unclassified Azospirillum]|uniref:cache domain-containing protein n=1 Tax=unclassified Azospirillum TaxID=2630922 RepID=UPI000B712408|nr:MULTISPECIES: cache domain-containing protein [unclassified Azospirillum]SNS28193.1 Single Cache domain 2-containing protein [Azospirillum sp. RU38E]SNS46724.1 Single Cache domain 2-containing protein [Azospirillum sp. RU37A]